jgi:endothelin-converting enzyme/putative endopeptidase
MLALSGLPAATATRGARDVLRIEGALARASLTRVERRDPRRLWNPTPRAALDRLTPAFPWADYLAAAGAPPLAWLDVTEPRFYREVSRLLGREPLQAWKHYLRWQLLQARAPHLGRAFQEEHHAFTEGHLRGVAALAPRWKRCVAWADRDLGEALGKLFVARVFPPAVKADAERMVELVEEAMRRRLGGLSWMGPRTREAALSKLAAMRNKIGYPERWRDYAGLRVERGDHAGNVDRALTFEGRRQLARIGQKVDRAEWQMTPPTVNASYDPSLNEMNFPAGVLLPPLWDPRLDLAPGYGNTGGTVGHELVHGFDDEGRRFDARGNMVDWWTPADARAFQQRARCIVDQYAAYPVEGEVRINSRLTLGEDLADLGGLVLALDAWRLATAGQVLEPRDGLSPTQRFFVGFAQWDCANVRPEDARQRALTDEHSPPRWRINGVVANLPAFAEAFGCRAGQPLVRARPCQVW